MNQQILIIEDNKPLNKLISEELSEKYKVDGLYNWQQAKKYLNENEPDLIISDVRLPDTSISEHISYLTDIAPTILITAYASIEDAVKSMKAGAAEYLVKPVSPDKLMLMVEKTLEADKIRVEYQFIKDNLKSQLETERLIGDTEAINKVKEMIYAVAPSDMSVLITGESGTGKELVARNIHDNSLRANQNFIVVDCCTIQEQLFESELFGHEKGSFTGADKQKKGLIEVAKGGTLFLDEIGEIDQSIQAKLLRVLENGTFRRVGGNKTLNSDVRIVAATNRENLLELSNEGKFRLDLFYRLNAFSIETPPLRERREDVEKIAKYFLKNHKFSQRINKKLTPEAVRKLVSYDWPGNVRELKNVIERSIILSQNHKKIRAKHLAFDVSAETVSSVNMAFNKEPSLDELTYEYLKMLLVKFSGRRSQIAQVMGVSERSVYRMIKRYKLN